MRVCCVRPQDLFELSLSKCLLRDGGLSPGLCCEITELDWHPYIQEDCSALVDLVQDMAYEGTEVEQDI